MAVTLVRSGNSTSDYSFTAATLAEAKRQMTHLGPGGGDGHHAACCDVPADIMQGRQTGILVGSTISIAELGI